MIAVGCDGTAVNTGPKGGTVRRLEDTLKKPLHCRNIIAADISIHHVVEDAVSVDVAYHIDEHCHNHDIDEED
ncbi:Hypothetical predicted protein [Octopus vulgaris]|uniref:Uncharacterized protein n=1 Tax=Octopus vulgaris TaxID=6645 RepID=A0AA36F962_OCTVU|nr:Hypothetical predicted protein [Octopus vulgaris]